MKAKDIEDCSQCPWLGEYCKGGMTSDGCGRPIEPPCCSWDPEEDIEDIYDSQAANESAYQDYISHEIEKEKAVKLKKEITKRKRRESSLLLFEENREIKRLRKQIEANNYLLCLTNAFNFVSKTIGGSESKQKEKHVLEIENKRLEDKIEELKLIKKNKLKELRNKKQELSNERKI